MKREMSDAKFRYSTDTQVVPLIGDSSDVVGVGEIKLDLVLVADTRM